MTLFTL
jgi:hypothetical protein